MHNAERFDPDDYDAYAYASAPAGSDWTSATLHGVHTDGPGAPVVEIDGRRARKPADDGSAARHLPYAAGLDGIRALAVAAVVVYHLGAPWLPGGFLGVDVFFALSGFLITSILLREFSARGRIDVRTFYVRRARRLLPALFAMLAAVTLATWLVARDQLFQLRGDVVAALTYSTNWTQIAWHRGYFQQTSLLQHLWSLAVEEQFYLLWPLILVACLAARNRRVVLLVAPAMAVVSLVLMAAQFHPGHPDRVYYGSDTHVSVMLFGATLAIVLAHGRHPSVTGAAPLAGMAADLAALAGLVGLAWAMTHVGYFATGLYRGGYLLVALAAVAVIHAAARQGSVAARLFGLAPLVWVGQRSYAIYLWHWPILMLSRPGIDTTWPTPIVITLQVLTTVVAADLSYRFVEAPIRAKGFRAVLRAFAARRGPGQRSRHAGLVSAVAVVVLGLVVVTLGRAPSHAPAGIQVDKTHPHITIKAVGRSAFGKPVRVSFFGDSQGMTLLLNRPNGLKKTFTLSDSTVEGCGVLLGTISSRVGYTRDLSSDCGSWPQQWRANAAKHKPQIAVVEIGAWDVFDDTVNGSKLVFGTPAWDGYFAAQLRKGIAILTGAGAQVALMGVPCYRPIAAGGLPLLPERGDDLRTRHINTLLTAAAAAQPKRVFLVQPPAAFCTDPKIASNTAYRWDGTHYYIPGAALVFRTITPQLLKIPPRPPR